MKRGATGILRDVVEADIAAFFEHQRDPEANRMAAFPAKEEEAFTAHWLRILANDEVKKTIVCDGEVAGYIVAYHDDGKRLVGYWIGREFWGRGLATQALTELLAEVTERPLHAYVAKVNAGSIRVLEKCGFVPVSDESRQDAALGVEVDELLMELR